MCLFIIIVLIIILLILLLYYNITTEYFKSNKHIYLFWTGGYDSTFRLCQALLDENKIVTPIYISYKHLDNLPNKTYKRNSQVNELNAINKITQYIKKQFPYKFINLKPLLIIPKINISKHVLISMKNLWIKGKNHRALSQYGGLAQVSLDLNTPIEIAVENSKHSTMRNMVIKDIIKQHNSYKIKNTKDDIYIFRNLLFPTIFYTKKDMLNIAIQNGYDNILNITWSCWFPINGKPCKKCPMCYQRII